MSIVHNTVPTIPHKIKCKMLTRILHSFSTASFNSSKLLHSDHRLWMSKYDYKHVHEHIFSNPHVYECYNGGAASQSW